MTQRRLTEVAATYRTPSIGELNKRAQFRTREDVPGNGHMGVDTVYHNTFDTWAKLAAIPLAATTSFMLICLIE
ncbi:TPA: hypothetical protein ACPY50_001307 [Yersinia enterocolitica]